MRNLNPKSAAIKLSLSLAFCHIILGCAPTSNKSVEQASQSISDSLGCTNVQSKIFDAFYTMIDQDQAVPSPQQIKKSLSLQMQKLFSKASGSVEREKIIAIKSEVESLVDLMLSETKRNSNITWKEQIQKLIEYEMEDKSDTVTANSSKLIAEKTKIIRSLAQSLELACSAPATSIPNSELPKTQSSLSKGLKMVFATAYQSCGVLDLPEMDRATADVVGITRIGTHQDGVGGKRGITDLKSVQATHYYIRGIASENQCLSISQTPLIYDYGGEPYVSGNTINFFKNAGTGTDVLGVDCSAYVSSAIAVAGLRYKPGLDNKPIFIRQTSSKFINAEASGFKCFENITVTRDSNIKAGDIIGVKGHMLTIDRTGEDPFGLRLLKSVDQCNSLNFQNFDIVVNQSSPSKNGIGINKYIARDYLAESGKMRVAFVEMGKQACLAYFQNKSLKPTSSEWGFLRHKGTPECLAPRVIMAGESCTQKCF